MPTTAHGVVRALLCERPMHEQRDREQLATDWARAWLRMNTQASVAFWLVVVYPTAWSSTRFPEARRRFPEPSSYGDVPFQQMREEMVVALAAMESLPPGLSGGGGGYGRSTFWIHPSSLKLVLSDEHVEKLHTCVRALREAIQGGSEHVCNEGTQQHILDGPMAPGEVYGRGQYLGTHAYGAMAWGLWRQEGRLEGSAYRQMGAQQVRRGHHRGAQQDRRACSSLQQARAGGVPQAPLAGLARRRVPVLHERQGRRGGQQGDVQADTSRVAVEGDRRGAAVARAAVCVSRGEGRRTAFGSSPGGWPGLVAHARAEHAPDSTGARAHRRYARSNIRWPINMYTSTCISAHTLRYSTG